MVISFDVAKNQYINTPMKEEYSPYSAGNLAKMAYAMPCGMTTAPTVTPIDVSLTHFSDFYEASHLRLDHR